MNRRLPLLAALGLAACSSPSTPAVPPAGEGVGEDLARMILEGSWAGDVQADPAGVNAVLDGAGGDGWVALFHRDLATADAVFQRQLGADVGSTEAMLGLARVHLARAATYEAAADLHQAAAAALVAYRAEHRGRVRLGPYEQALAHLVTPGADSGAGDRTPDATGDPAVLAAITAHAAGDSSALPASWSPVRRFVDAVEAGDLTMSMAALEQVDWSRADLEDPLGADAETGLAFTAAFYDPERLPALAAHHAQAAWGVGGAVPGMEQAFKSATAPYLPDGFELPAASGLTDPREVPSVLLHFVAPWVTPRDAPGGVDDSLTGLLLAQAPQTFTVAPDAAAIDRELRAVEALDDAMKTVLGEGLVTELQVHRSYADRILRRRMEQLGSTHPALAVRLGRRSLDMNPGALGGAANSSRTRVSWRNDRAFLIRFAHQLWVAGHPAEALELMHPLAQEDPALQPVVHYLGQLDAANSVGTAGKASQL